MIPFNKLKLKQDSATVPAPPLNNKSVNVISSTAVVKAEQQPSDAEIPKTDKFGCVDRGF